MKLNIYINLLLLFLCLNVKAISVSINLTLPEVCNEGKGQLDALVTGGVAPYSYLWSNAITTQGIWNITAGNYTVTVTDAIGDTASKTYNLVNYNDLSAGNSPANFMENSNGFFLGIGCPGACNSQLFIGNGSGFFSFPGTGPYTIQSPSLYAGGNFIGGGCGGQIVNYVIVDALGCPGTGASTFDELVSIKPIQFNISAACNGNANGQINATFNNYTVLNGGGPGPRVHILDSLGTDVVPSQVCSQCIFTNIPPGTYLLTSLGATSAVCYWDTTIVVTDAGSNCGNLSGTVFLDTLHNCIKDPIEPIVKNAKIKVTPGPIYYTADNLGHFSIQLPFGNYSITSMPETNFSVVCQPQSLNLDSINNSVVIDLADSVNNTFDLQVAMTGQIPRPGFSYTLFAEIKNNSFKVSNVTTIILKYDTSLTLLSCTSPYLVSGPNIISINVGLVNAFSTVTIPITFTVDNNLSLIGTTISSSINCTSVLHENYIGNNKDTITTIVSGAIDPNQKTVWPDRGTQHLYYSGIDNYLKYTISLQNTGTDTAFNIVLIDTLDAQLEINSLQVGAASHKYHYELSGSGILKVYFDNILLPDSNINESKSHGIISYKIRPKNSVIPPSIIYNTAGIYFDFNSAVNTNIVETQFGFPSGINEVSNFNKVILSPNPNNGNFELSLTELHKGTSFIVFDLEGKMVYQKQLSSKRNTIQIKELDSGIYFYKVESIDFSWKGKFIIR